MTKQIVEEVTERVHLQLRHELDFAVNRIEVFFNLFFLFFKFEYFKNKIN